MNPLVTFFCFSQLWCCCVLVQGLVIFVDVRVFFMYRFTVYVVNQSVQKRAGFADVTNVMCAAAIYRGGPQQRKQGTIYSGTHIFRDNPLHTTTLPHYHTIEWDTLHCVEVQGSSLLYQNSFLISGYWFAYDNPKASRTKVPDTLSHAKVAKVVWCHFFFLLFS